MMSVVEKVKAAKSPSAALLVLAEEVDALASRLDAQPQADPWSEWDDPETHEQVNKELVELAEKERENLERDIRLLRGAAQAENNAEERQSIEAAIRLKEDELAKLAAPVPKFDDGEGQRAKIDSGEGEAVIELPPASEEQKRLRAELAERLELDVNFGEGFNEAYVKGGPLWLYYGNREFVVNLPNDIKRQMVHDVQQHSPDEAHELGRDILKDLSAGDGPTETLERVLGS